MTYVDQEGGLFPGIVLYLSGFYRRHELQVRVALFFSASALSGAFSGLLAAAIQQMDGLGGMQGWKWIFCLEGLFTVLFGVFSFFVLPNNPSQVRSFKPEHVACCEQRLRLDTDFPDAARVNMKSIASAPKSIHVWMSCLALFASGTCLFGLAYFTPSIVQTLGYSRTRTQLMTVPPFAIAFVVTMISSYLADRYKQRGLSAIAVNIFALIGAAMTINARSFGARYAALCLLITGVYASAPSLISWIPNNSAGHVRRATAIAMGFVSTNSGGILSTWIYPRSNAPYYPTGAKVNLSMVVIQLVVCAVQILWLRRKNQEKDHKAQQLLEGVEGRDLGEQFAVLGDKHPRYRYTY
jgi:predicted MFS family arabinose efflux permease